MDYRKLISFGKNSYVITLPKAWVRQNKLKKGDLIYVDEAKGSLILQPKSAESDSEEESKIIINVDGKQFKQVKRQIIGAYIRNVKTIILEGDEIKDRAKDFQSVIQSLVALEVMEQTSKKIVAKDFLNLDNVSIKALIRKIDIIIRSMLEDCVSNFEEDNYESINYRDADVNKLTFMMFRIIKYGFENPTYMFKKFNLSIVDLSSLWWVSFDLESIADEIKRMARYMNRTNLSKKEKEEYKNILGDIKKSYLGMMKAYYDRDVESVHQIINNREGLIKRCEEFYSRNRTVEYIGFLIDKSKAAIVHINHIGRVLYQW